MLSCNIDNYLRKCKSERYIIIGYNNTIALRNEKL